MLTFRLGQICKRKESLPAHAIERDGAGVRLYPREFDQSGFVAELLMKLQGSEWLVLGVIPQEELQRAIMVLQQALAWANENSDLPRQLQTTWLWGSTFDVDERLCVMRRRENPSDFVSLELS
jgi:hypothetical protein